MPARSSTTTWSYQNTTQGIEVSGSAASAIGNTVYQQNGPAIVVQGAEPNNTLENNIIWVVGGPAIQVAADTELGFSSDYNLFDLGAGGVIGNWGGTTITTLASWIFELGFDQTA